MGKGLKLLCKQAGLNLVFRKTCSVEEYMTLDDISNCNNPTLVKGSLQEPAFFTNINNICINNDKIIKFLDLIIKKNIDNKKIIITLGSRVIYRFESGII